jgi:hypothetical protein
MFFNIDESFSIIIRKYIDGENYRIPGSRKVS